LEVEMLPYDTARVSARFAAKVAYGEPDDCWLWQGALCRGYGSFMIGPRQHGAHRVAWILEHGREIPKGMHVLHDCPGGDKKACVNPAHLRIGTNADNRADAVRKRQMARGARHGTYTKPWTRQYGNNHGSRRHPERLARGERVSRSVLTEVIVRHIRLVYAAGLASQKQLGRVFGVSQATIWGIVERKTWRHVE
jgi:HNH endonuclease